MSDESNSFDALQKMIYGVFALTGAGIIVGAMFWNIETRRFINSSAAAEGIVTVLEAGGSHPQIKFTAADGREIKYSQNGLIGGYRVSDQVKVLYDPQNPRRATVETFGALWGFDLLAFVMGFVFLGAASFKFVSSRQSIKAQNEILKSE